MTTRRKKEWFDDEAFWRETYPFMFPKERLEAGGEDVRKVLALTKPRGKAALDLCCGPGRCSVALARAGFKVTGVDRTKFLLDKARARARAAGGRAAGARAAGTKARAKIEWVQSDMRDFVRPEAFDLVISMFTSFGYFDAKHEDTQVLRNILTSLKPGGACLIQLMGKERLAKIFLPTTSDTLPDGRMLIQRHEIFDDWTRIRNEWIVIGKGKSKRFKFHHTMYSGQEMRDLMERAGFTGVKLYGNLDGDAYGRNSIWLIAVGRKAPKDQ
jgi:SAM-dependent methyltransferase